MWFSCEKVTSVALHSFKKYVASEPNPTTDIHSCSLVAYTSFLEDRVVPFSMFRAVACSWPARLLCPSWFVCLVHLFVHQSRFSALACLHVCLHLGHPNCCPVHSHTRDKVTALNICQTKRHSCHTWWAQKEKMILTTSRLIVQMH